MLSGRVVMAASPKVNTVRVVFETCGHAESKSFLHLLILGTNGHPVFESDVKSTLQENSGDWFEMVRMPGWVSRSNSTPLKFTFSPQVALWEAFLETFGFQIYFRILGIDTLEDIRLKKKLKNDHRAGSE